MSLKPEIKQTYWPSDSADQVTDKLKRLATALIDRGFPVQVVAVRYQKKRTPEANAYLWAVPYVLMSDASGYTKEEIHDAMCRKFFGTKVVELMGEKFEAPNRTTTTNEAGEKEWLGSMDFAEFVDFVIREAAEWYDVYVPPPSPQDVPRGE